MNITIQELEMFEGAKEIQKLWQPRCGNLFAYSSDHNFSDNFGWYLGNIRKWNDEKECFIDNHYVRDAGGIKRSTKNFKKESYIWIPFQGELQEMISQEYLTGFIYDLYEFSKEWLYYDNGNDLRFLSIKQLWLGFVMYEKFNKIWNEKEWRKR